MNYSGYGQMNNQLGGLLLVVVIIIIFVIILCAISQNNQLTPPPPEPKEVASSVDAVNSSPMELEVFNLVNQVRAQGAVCGGVAKPPVLALQWNDQLASAAYGHSRDMADKNYFSHTSQDGRTFVSRVLEAGYTGYQSVGENISAGYSNSQTVMNGWMSSPGHCNNIMSPNFRELGVGYAYNSGSTYKNYWTQDFGRKFGTASLEEVKETKEQHEDKGIVA